MLKNTLVAGALMVAMAIPSAAVAAPGGFGAHPRKPIRVGIDFPTSIVVGDPLNDFAVVGLGIGLLRVEYLAMDNLSLMARAGAIFHFGRENRTFWEFTPLFLGAKFYPVGNFFVSGEVGPTYLDINIERDNDIPFDDRDVFSRSDWRFGGAFLAGVELGNFEIKGGFWIPSFGHIDDGVEIAFQVGYSFLYF